MATQQLGTTSQLGRDQFMQLLVTQMRNQNPLEPMKDAEFIAQLAQFSSLEGIEKLNTSFDDMLSLQQLTQGSNLIGKTVQFQTGDPPTLGQGKVDGVTVQNGAVQLMVGSNLVPLTQVRSMLAPASGA
jgi:flagellar basal-body rod modification protein FlgD